jgi:hypothetical protein
MSHNRNEKFSSKAKSRMLVVPQTEEIERKVRKRKKERKKHACPECVFNVRRSFNRA